MSNALSARKMWMSGLLVAVVGAAVAVGSAQARGMGGMDGMEGGHGSMHGGRGMERGMGHGMGLPFANERMLDLVKATDAQRAQIRQIAETARKDMQTQHEAGRTLRDESMALFAQPNVDAGAAEAMRQKMLAQHDAVSKRQMQAMLEVSRVLTPEQRKTLAEKMAQRRDMMARHMQERQRLEGAPR